jgi:hypothetical protein
MLYFFMGHIFFPYRFRVMKGVMLLIPPLACRRGRRAEAMGIEKGEMTEYNTISQYSEIKGIKKGEGRMHSAVNNHVHPPFGDPKHPHSPKRGGVPEAKN